MRMRLWMIFVKGLLLIQGKLKGNRTKEKKLMEALVYLAQISQSLERISVGDDGKVKGINTIFQTCLEKYDKGAAKYGEFVPLEDKRDLIFEAQQELYDAMNYIAMLMVQMEDQENAKPSDKEAASQDDADCVETKKVA